MKTRLLTVAALLASTASAHAVGLDRSGQRIGILFEEGNRVELSFGYTDPSIEGQTINEPAVVGPLAGAPIDNVGDSFLIWNLGLKYELNDRLSFAIISDEPYGSDTLYPGSSASTILGGTGATVDSNAVTALARYKFNDNWSVHGGIRYQEVSAGVTLGGAAFNASPSPTPNGVNGYSGVFESDGDVGFVVGGAYEIPSIALRVALTYNSGTTHQLRTTETVRGIPISLATGGAVPDVTTTEVDTPETINLDFQTGIAANTLLFGNIRYARYSDTVVRPAGFSALTGGRPLTDLEDGYDFEIGVGRRFNEKWSGSVAVGFSTVGDDNLVSPLAPTNGSRHIAVGAKYDVNDQFAISGGVRYTILGDAVSAPGGRGVANFDGNNAVSVGVKFAYQF